MCMLTSNQLTLGWEPQLFTNDTSIVVVKEIITDCTPLPIAAYLHSSFHVSLPTEESQLSIV